MAGKKSRSIRKLIGIVLLGLIIIAIVWLSTQFEINGRIVSGGITRKYLIYVPESYDQDSPSPLVISIHGFVQWPAHQRTMTGWNKLADEYGFLVIYPRGTGFPLRWNSWPDSDRPGSRQDDLSFFADLLDHLESNYAIDPGRIYVNGMSNGGGMSDLLACELSDRITAIGGVAGAYPFPRDHCTPHRPVPVIAFHGVDDQVVPYLGGSSSRDDSFVFPSVGDWATSWAGINGCRLEPERTKITENVTRMDYLHCENEARVVLYEVKDGGHTWPGGEDLPVWIAGYTNQEINASGLMWEFFRDFTLE